MPKIESRKDEFARLLGTDLPEEELEDLLTTAKAELDEPVNADGVIKFELNDTNRPDLWSTPGLARQLRMYRGGAAPIYDFVSRKGEERDAGDRVIEVEKSVQGVRPYVVGFEFHGPAVTEETLEDIIQAQEKLTWNFGQKRRAVAMGVYRSDLFSYPIRYRAVEPTSVSFTPLGHEAPMDMATILAEHEKGKEFGGILDGVDRYPLIVDAEGGVLSFPPVINSADIGAVQPGDTTLFVELTGTDIYTLTLACSIVAADLADLGFEIRPLRVRYPFDTPLGREIVTPFYFQQPQQTHVSYASKLLGREVTADESVEGLSRIGVKAEAKDSVILAYPPVYRNDYLHSVDVIEDIMIGLGMDSFEPDMSSEFTVGRLSATERYSRRIKSILVGLGFQEMVFNYLASFDELVGRMYPQDEHDEAARRLVRISNPVSEKFEYVRSSAIPSLLGAESVSANAVYPHHIFEVGKTVTIAPDTTAGTATHNSLCMMTADAEADFNTVTSHVSAFLYYLNLGYSLRAAEDARFIPGRAAEVVIRDEAVGILGEIHPRVLTNWGIEVPCVVFEMTFDSLVEGH
jgi:phenylalanyl-tRNA synthetase beta chain